MAGAGAVGEVQGPWVWGSAGGRAGVRVGGRGPGGGCAGVDPPVLIRWWSAAQSGRRGRPGGAGSPTPNRKLRVHHGARQRRTASSVSSTVSNRRLQVRRAFSGPATFGWATATTRSLRLDTTEPPPNTRSLRLDTNEPRQARATCGSARQGIAGRPAHHIRTPVRTSPPIGGTPVADVGGGLRQVAAKRTTGSAQEQAARSRSPPQPAAQKAASSRSSTASAVTGRGFG